MFQYFLDLFQTNMYLILFIVIFVDCFPVFGFLLPEEFFITMAGFYASMGSHSYITGVIIATTAMVIGQSVMYKVSQRHGKLILKFFRFKDEKRKIIEKYIDGNIFWMKFLFRLTSTTRTFVAVISGYRKYSFQEFIKLEIVVSLIRSLFYISLGYFIGESVDQIDSVVDKLGYLIVTIILVSTSVSVISSRKVFRDAEKGISS